MRKVRCLLMNEEGKTRVSFIDIDDAKEGNKFITPKGKIWLIIVVSNVTVDEVSYKGDTKCLGELQKMKLQNYLSY